jgi:hypothetical protein
VPTIYEQFGFSDNPFTTRPLQPDAVGGKLLVGRERELSALTRRLITPPKCVTLEGANGIGKTSLVNVAVHRLYHAFSVGTGTDLVIPCGRTFQLDSIKAASDLEQEVLHEIAQTLLRHTKALNATQKLPSDHALSAWLNSPQLASWQGGVQVAIAGFSLGKTQETNTSAGFQRSGFRQLVEEWLGAVFPGGRGGGIVCVLDNLELLETSTRAKQMLEALRDTVLTMSGLRWVLCGSAGIVKSIASSPRLQGVLHEPLELAGIEDKFAPEVLTSRLKAFESSTDPYMPLTSDDFELLYQTFHSNLRNTLSHSDDYWAMFVRPSITAQMIRFIRGNYREFCRNQ